MNRYLFLRIVVCIFIFGFCLYFYIDKQNELTSLKIKLPKITGEIETIKEENKHLQYEIDQFENPTHLMELARSPEYGHLKHPLIKDILKVNEGMAFKEDSNCNTNNNSSS